MDKKRFCKIVILVLVSLHSYTQNTSFEQKALEYFCNYLEDIKKETNIEKIVFSGKTQGVSSNAFDIADCIGDINYLKDSVANRPLLDSIEKANSLLTLRAKKLVRNCLVTRSNFDNRSKFTLYIFESIKYKNAHYVELYLKNKKEREVWIICLKFDDNTTNIISRCSKYIHYSGY